MTSIEWTDETWNPTVGCSKVSPGCDGCYAIDVAHRGMQDAHRGLTIRRPGEPVDWTGEVRLLPGRLETPYGWSEPRRVFVDSMSDLFHAAVPMSFVVDVWATMALTPRHTYQVLTKRPQRMASVLGRDAFDADVEYRLRMAGRTNHVDWQSREYPELGEVRWLPNAWLGTSIESDRYVFRADHLRATPAAVRFLSCEPLLGPLESLELDGIDWVIAGGESGQRARPTHPDWVRALRDECLEAEVPFFFKQWGTWLPYELDPQPPFWLGQDGDLVDGHLLPADLVECMPGTVRGWRCDDLLDEAIYRRAGKKAAGRLLDGRTWDEFPTTTRSTA